MTDKNFLGIPISGDIRTSNRRVPQKTLEELQPFIEALLADPYVEAFGWIQYTPYFNDGEPCIFGVDEIGFRIAGEPPMEEWEDDGEDYDEEYGEDWAGRTLYRHPLIGKYLANGVEDKYKATEAVCRAFAEQLGSGAYDDVLYNSFGDHATVTVRADKILVDTYEHE